MKFYSLLSILSLTFCGGLLADQYFPDWGRNIPGNETSGSVHYGPTTISNQTMEDLTVYGPATINNSKVTKMATIKGPVKAINSSFNSVNINGIANFEDVKVTKELFINGPIYAKNSTLGEVSVASDEVALSNSTAAKIVVRKNDRNNNRQHVYLEKGSKVESIVFEMGDGQVILGDSTVSVKDVKGGVTESQ